MLVGLNEDRRNVSCRCFAVTCAHKHFAQIGKFPMSFCSVWQFTENYVRYMGFWVVFHVFIVLCGLCFNILPLFFGFYWTFFIFANFQLLFSRFCRSFFNFDSFKYVHMQKKKNMFCFECGAVQSKHNISYEFPSLKRMLLLRECEIHDVNWESFWTSKFEVNLLSRFLSKWKT